MATPGSMIPVSAEVVLSVGIGQCIVSADPQALLVSYGLGSCVGIGLWDGTAHVGALLHVLLPEPGNTITEDTVFRFARTGIPEMIRRVERAGGVRSRLRTVAAGGAQMLATLGQLGPMQGIGARNSATVIEVLHQEGLTLAAYDFGGSTGRTLGLCLADGRAWYRLAGGETRPLL